MPLSCSCDYDGDYAWWFYSPRDYSRLDTSRRRRCSSCGRLIDVGDLVAKFQCSRSPRDDVEIRIWGEEAEIPIANKYQCEECADIYFSLLELGFECVAPDENMREMAREYHAIYGQRRSA